ncbi:MAG: apolipoprotein N-acyltransferase, partial [Nitrospinae bacterium]|nr:apolipoprotein N-acyltransferase [Nitrospinota bacterium]
MPQAAPGSPMTRTACPLAILSGLLLVLIFPWYDVEWLAWVAFVPLLLATRDLRAYTALGWGWLGGFVGYAGILRWIPHTMITYGGVPEPVSYGILLLLVAYVGLYVGVFTAGWAWSVRRWPRGVWLFAPALWVALEWVRAHALSGFPWASLGYSQYLNRPLIQIAELTSVYGVSFVLVLGNVALAQLLHAVPHRAWRTVVPPCAFTVACLMAVVGYGWRRLDEVSRAVAAAPGAVEVALLQGNIEQGLKWEPTAQEAIFSIYRTLTHEAAAAPGVALIVWPEAATPFFFASDRNFRTRQLELARDAGRPLLFGSPTHAQENGQDIMYNSAFLVGPDASVWGWYDKMHLVPFGEYIPLRGLLFFLDKLVTGIGDFRSGEGYTVMAIPQGRFSVLICFEMIFPELVRQFVRHGAQFLVNITNDAWFGRSPASYQHLSMVVFRAIETRLPVVRAANTGISAVIDPTGRLVQQTDLFVRTWIKDRIVPADGPMT